MKRFFGLLNLLLCLELIVGPIAPQYSFLIPGAHAQETSCPAGTSFDSTLNRCITTEETATIMNAVASCAPQDKACYKANADSALKKAEQESEVEKQIKNKGGLMGTPMKAAVVAVPLFMAMQGLFKAKGTRCPTSPSVYVMLGAGAAIFIGDLYSNSKHKKRLKKIKQEWEGIRKGEKSGDKGSGEKGPEVTTASLSKTEINPDVRKAQAKESQSEAFEMLAKSEDSLASAAKFKRGIYGVGALAFAAASVMSFIESKRLDAQTCPVTESASVTNFESQPLPLDDLKYFYAQFDQARRSDDLASFFTYQYGFEDSLRRRSSPKISEYELLKSDLAAASSNDLREVLPLLKSISMKMLSELNPITIAHADDGVEEIVVTAQRSPRITLPEPEINAINAAELAPMKTDVNSLIQDIPNLKPEPSPRTFLEKPIPRAIISGVFAVWAGVMAMHANKQAKVSKARARFLRDMKDDFNDATGAISCTQQDRGNVNNLRCYCYNSSGQRDPQKSNSQACVKLFTGKNLSGETNYLAGTGLGSQKVCMTNSGVDENCSCRQNNTCLNAVPSNLQGFNPGTLSLVSSGVNPMNQVTTGQLAAGSIDAASAVNKAGKILDVAQKVGSQVKGNNDPKAAKKMADRLIASTQGGVAPTLSSPSSGTPFSMSPSQAAAQLERELKEIESPVNTASSRNVLPQAGGNGNGMEQLEFGITPGQLAADQTTLAEMNQNLNYGQNDINSGSDTNLFEVLSNRYQRSGMRRLFDETGTAPAEPANKDDINP